MTTTSVSIMVTVVVTGNMCNCNGPLLWLQVRQLFDTVTSTTIMLVWIS